MIEQRTVNAATCDGCSKVRLAQNDTEPVIGFVGTVTEHTGIGGMDRKTSWFACSKRCIGKAAYTAVVRADYSDLQGELPL